MKVSVDENKCIACNMCDTVSEGVIGLQFGKNGKAGVNPNSDLNDPVVQENVELACETCPVRAICIEN